MRPSIIIPILALAALAAILLITPAHAFVPKYDPSEIAVDANGNVYTIMEVDSAVGEGLYVYAPDGTQLQSFRRPRLSDVAIDGNGTVYVVYLTGRQVERLEKNGSFSVVWHENRPDYFISYFAVDRNNDILVSDFNYSQEEIRTTEGFILGISPGGELINVIESTPDVSLAKAFRISVSGNGTIYLTNFNRSYMAIYPDGNRSVINSTGSANRTLHEVMTAEAGADGYLYIGEMPDGRVLKLAPDGTPVAQWDGCGPDKFISTVSIAADRNGRVYVSDPRNQRVVWFDGNRYKFGDNPTENMAGKGALWGNIIAGDNYSTAHPNGEYEVMEPLGSPGFDSTVALAGLCFAGAVLCLSRMRKD